MNKLKKSMNKLIAGEVVNSKIKISEGRKIHNKKYHTI